MSEWVSECKLSECKIILSECKIILSECAGGRGKRIQN